MDRKIILLTVLFSFLIVPLSAQKNLSGYFSFGIPLNSNINWKEANFSTEIGLNKSFFKQTHLGIGASYYSLNLKPSTTTLSFDKKVLDFYVEAVYSLKISNKVAVKPGTRLGYAFVNYSLNEFQSSSQKTNGFSMTPEIILAYNLTEKIELNAGGYYNLIFSKMNVDSELIIPQSYVADDNDVISSLCFKFGITYSF